MLKLMLVFDTDMHLKDLIICICLIRAAPKLFRMVDLKDEQWLQ